MIYLLMGGVGVVAGVVSFRLGYRAGTIDERLRCDDIIQGMIERDDQREERRWLRTGSQR